MTPIATRLSVLEGHSWQQISQPAGALRLSPDESAGNPEYFRNGAYLCRTTWDPGVRDYVGESRTFTTVATPGVSVTINKPLWKHDNLAMLQMNSHENLWNPTEPQIRLNTNGNHTVDVLNFVNIPKDGSQETWDLLYSFSGFKDNKNLPLAFIMAQNLPQEQYHALGEQGEIKRSGVTFATRDGLRSLDLVNDRLQKLVNSRLGRNLAEGEYPIFYNPNTQPPHNSRGLSMALLPKLANREIPAPEKALVANLLDENFIFQEPEPILGPLFKWAGKVMTAMGTRGIITV